MIDRYTRPEMAALWTKQKKFETWLEVELNATDAWVKLGKVPAEAAAEMRKNAKFTVERVEEIEQSTRHDVVAFTRCVAESLGEESKYLHFGLTSTDVVDTALSSISRIAVLSVSVTTFTSSWVASSFMEICWAWTSACRNASTCALP